jgi:GTP-binding protein
LINFFKLDDERRLVDLPGYGYAKVPGHMRQKWGLNMADYIESRVALKGVILLMDIRHAMTELDQQMLGWCNDLGRPVHVLLTKADKLKFGAAKSSFLKVQKELSHFDQTSVQMFSSKTGDGLSEVWSILDKWNEFS